MTNERDDLIDVGTLFDRWRDENLGIVHHPPLADRLIDILNEVVLGIDGPENEPPDHREYRQHCVEDIAAIYARGHDIEVPS